MTIIILIYLNAVMILPAAIFDGKVRYTVILCVYPYHTVLSCLINADIDKTIILHFNHSRIRQHGVIGQKVIFGKWLERAPSVFLMDEPTRGIDVGAKYEIYELIIKMAKMGKTIIVVSSEMPEILGITNRIGVMSNGRLAGIVNTKETDQEELLRLSAKYL